MPLTLPFILRRTPRSVRDASVYVKLLKFKTGTHDKGLFRGLPYAAAQTYSTHLITPSGFRVRNRNRTKYVTVITFLNSKLQVSVSCSCPDFCYRAEVALHDRGAAQIEYSNGAQPMITNPNLEPRGCKHLVALYRHIQPMIGSK